MTCNRLAAAASPYLRQHADNPLDWYEWGEEAFARARELDRPVLLSIGYSTCHWCHVMARESFSDAGLGAQLDRAFVSIKLDREERPDLDSIYMTFVQATQGHGGWPLTVFLTPEREPFFGATYVPPDRFGELLDAIATAWRDRRDELLASAARIGAELRRMSTPPAAAAQLPDPALVEQARSRIAGHFDEEWAGWGRAPKFPQPSQLGLMLAGSGTARAQALATLRAMAAGGIHDQLGGGFHRYSVDRFWHIPHYEKMLYDQGQLAAIYAEGHRLSGDPVLAEVALGICRYGRRDLLLVDGMFAAAEDADSDRADGRHGEGAFYVWTLDELRAAAGPELELACAAWGLRAEGNVPPGSDPHGELSGTNTLIRALDAAALAERCGPDAPQRLERLRTQLLEQRSARPRPHRDDKVLAGWNGLMIGGLARCARLLQQPELATVAVTATKRLRELLWDESERRLWRVALDGRRGTAPGCADDYAQLAWGLLELYTSCGDAAWLLWARDLLLALESRFAAPEGSWYQSEATATDLLWRPLDQQDGAEPAAGSLAAGCCLRLAILLDDEHWRQRGEAALRAHGALLEQAPQALPALLLTLASASAQRRLVVAGDVGPARQALWTAAAQLAAPELPLLLLDLELLQQLGLTERADLAAMARSSAPAAYLCEGRSCRAPVHRPEELRELLRTG